MSIEKLKRYGIERNDALVLSAVKVYELHPLSSIFYEEMLENLVIELSKKSLRLQQELIEVRQVSYTPPSLMLNKDQIINILLDEHDVGRQVRKLLDLDKLT